MTKFEQQVREHHIGLELDRVIDITFGDGLFSIKTISDVTYRAKSVILAQGMKPKKLGVEGEDRFLGRGLSVCSTCDGPLFKEKVVAVVGGGNSALQTAIEMSAIAKEVHLIVRSTIRADEIYLQQYEARKNIITHLGTTITGLLGENLLSGIIMRDAAGKETRLELDGLFAEIGWVPNTDMVADLVARNPCGEVLIDINCHTNIPGLFAAGDVTNIKGKQIIIAAGEGAKAALEAHEYLMRL